jgi:prepilin-type N-terminal cleavage/methylation domain-containing protein
MSERGFTLIELLVALLIGVIVFLAIGSFYLSTVRFYDQSSAQTTLQRQATLALEEMARQIRPASTIDTACAGLLRVVNANGTFCYYAGTGANNAPAGALCQALNGGVCRDLLAGGETMNLIVGGDGAGSLIRLVTQPNPVDPRCPAVAAGQFCLQLAPAATSADVAFAITDGLNVTTFSVRLMQRN